MAERRLLGRCAAPGLARGIVTTLQAELPARRDTGTPAEEATALRQALMQALTATEELAGHAESDAAEMLDFQAAMLSDEELIRPALEAIDGGQSADAAWMDTMAAEIAAYAAAEDAHFAARTADLEDIRDRVLAHLTRGAARTPIPDGAVVAAADLPLSGFLAIDWKRGGAIVLTRGSPASHVAMLARARDVPMVVGVGGSPEALAGHEALVDAAAGDVVLDPGAASRAAFAARLDSQAASAAATAEWRYRPAVTADHFRISVNINISDPAELEGLDPARCDGIGLVRTELLFHGAGGLPDEATQYQTYRRMAKWADGRPVTIRTLDAGGDKPIPGVTMDGESNPFLGLRGIRLSLLHPGMFRTQLRALARAAVHGAVRIMLPMVTIPEELEAARQLLDEAVKSLERDAMMARRPELGIMIEVPAAAIAVDLFDADFFSIGSNDLTQYVTAAARDIGTVAGLADPLNPAVLRLIAGVVRHGLSVGRDVSLCGDAGADPRALALLLRAGLRSVSVPPLALDRIKQAIAHTEVGPAVQ